MPSVWTLDLARGLIKYVRTKDFKALPNLRHLVLANNLISYLEADAFPTSIVNLHLGRNNLTKLNGTCRNLPNLKILFVNANNLTTLEDELPPTSHTLMMLLAQENQLKSLPSGLVNYPNLESVYFYDNRIKTLGGNFKYSHKLKFLWININQIEYLAEDEFAECEILEELYANDNLIPSINGSILPLKSLIVANFSYNVITEFALKDIAGLSNLLKLDLTHNRIEKLIGRFENQVEPHSLITVLKLAHNRLKSLDGALMGLNKLRWLDLSYNKLQKILPEDLIGLENLEHLDISFNQLKTLEETSKVRIDSSKLFEYFHKLKINYCFIDIPSISKHA